MAQINLVVSIMYMMVKHIALTSLFLVMVLTPCRLLIVLEIFHSFYRMVISNEDFFEGRFVY